MGLAFPAAELIMLRLVFGAAKNLKNPKKPTGDSKPMIRRLTRENRPVARGAKMHWTEEDKRELVKLSRIMNLSLLARRFRRTPAAILAMSYKLGIPIRTKKECPVKKVRETGFSRSNRHRGAAIKRNPSP